MLLAVPATAATVWRFDGACTASTREGGASDDLSAASAKPIACRAAVLISDPDGVAVVTAGTSADGGVPVSFGSVNFPPGPSGNVITMPVDEVNVGEGSGQPATGTCRLYGPDLEKVSAVRCKATVVDGERKRIVAVDVKVSAVRIVLPGQQ